MADIVLALNAGSSSIKFALFAPGSGTQPILRVKGQVEGIGITPHFTAKDATGVSLEEERWGGTGSGHDAVLPKLMAWVEAHLGGNKVAAVGHRVVHGGRDFTAPVSLTPEVVLALSALTPLAPLHQPHCLEPVRVLMAMRPALPQVACFDTAFHRTQPRIAQLFALPRHLIDDGIIRYGFHGLSYDYISSILPDLIGQRAQGRVIVAHLGHGASMCALNEGRSIATTMGFTALDGLVMGTRCGALDPGVILHLLQEKGMSVSEIADLLNNQSGLLGVSGISDDVRDLETSTDTRAKEALDLFAYQAIRSIGSLAAALGGVDVLVFTAGIGAHSSAVRQQICDELGWLGIELDRSANGRHGPRISVENSSVTVIALPTNEEIVIARATQKLATKH